MVHKNMEHPSDVSQGYLPKKILVKTEKVFFSYIGTKETNVVSVLHEKWLEKSNTERILVLYPQLLTCSPRALYMCLSICVHEILLS